MAEKREIICDWPGCGKPVGAEGYLINEAELHGGMSVIVIAATGQFDQTAFDVSLCGKLHAMAYFGERLDKVHQKGRELMAECRKQCDTGVPANVR